MTHKLLLLIINVVRARRGYHTRQCCYENQSPHPGLSVPLRYLLPAMRSVPAPVSLYRAHPRTHSTDIAQRGGLIQSPHPNPLPEGEGATWSLTPTLSRRERGPPGPSPQPSPGGRGGTWSRTPTLSRRGRGGTWRQSRLSESHRQLLLRCPATEMAQASL